MGDHCVAPYRLLHLDGEAYLSASEHVAGAVATFRAWYLKVKDHMPEHLRAQSELAMQHATLLRHVNTLVNIVAYACGLWLGSMNSENDEA